MAWTWPTGLFFIAIAIALIVMTLAELRYPTEPRRGFLPMVTTRGDRFFIALLSAAWIHLLWLGLVTLPLVGASIIAIVAGAIVFRWG